MRKRSLFLIISILLLSIFIPAASYAGNGEQIPFGAVTATGINPLYSDILTEDDIIKPEGIDKSGPASGTNSLLGTEQSAYKSKISDLAPTLAKGYKNRQSPITVYYKTSSAFVNDDPRFRQIFDAGFETDAPDEGDYLRWQWGTYNASTSFPDYDNGMYYYGITYYVSYYTTIEQEQEVTAAVNSLLNSFGFTPVTTDYIKIKTIYDWVCSHVTYDYDHPSDYIPSHTAYAALIGRNAVCQGYSLLTHRLLRESDINCRMVAGYGGGEAHGWNIVRLHGLYYNIDTTWDAGMTNYYYSYFLVSDANCYDHVRWDEYSTSAFYSSYPMGASNYVTVDADYHLVLDEPALPKASNTSAGIKLTWTKVSKANYYYIYRRTEYSEWVNIGSTESLTYTDSTASSGQKYYYSISADVKGYGVESTFDNYGTGITWVSQPKLSALTNTSSGIKLTWSAVPGAKNYYIYRQTSSGWVRIGDTTRLYYTNKSAESGKKYYYTVKAEGSDGTLSAYAGGKGLTRVGQPAISSISNASSGIQIKWSKVTGASQYNVYRKTSSGWTKIASTTSLSYTNKSAVSGTKYYYTVKACAADGTLSSYAGGKGLTRVGQPQISSISAVSDGIKLTWSKVSGATKYYVYRKTSSSGSWAQLGSTTSLSYTNKSAEYGRKYYYTVKAASSDGTLSAYAGGKGMIRLKKPVISSISNTSTGIKLTWDKVAGASKYNVYRKNSSGSYTKMGSTTGTSYTNGSVSSGAKYYYTVKAESSDGILSPAASVKELIRFSQPVISSISNTADGIKLSWSKVPGAAQYYVYRKTSSGSYTKIGSTTSLSYTNKSVSSGTKYSYAIKACTSSGLTQSCFSSSKALTRLSQPVLGSISKSSAGVKLTWGKVTGAGKYYVFRKTSGGKWSKIASTTSLSYTDSTAVKGTKYYYTVRAYNSAATEYSSYDIAGKTITR